MSAADGTLCGMFPSLGSGIQCDAGFSTVDAILEKYVPEAERSEVRRVMYGWNMGKPVQSLEISSAATELAKAKDFDLQAYKFGAAMEQMRKPRVVKVGLIQNAVTHPSTAPFLEQAEGIRERIRIMLDAAGEAGVKIACLQEAWPMPFAFCTREKQVRGVSETISRSCSASRSKAGAYRKYNLKWDSTTLHSPELCRGPNCSQWCEFAESAETGPSTKFCQEMAKKWGMVIVSPILERDEVRTSSSDFAIS
eukprot:9493672-Pyramimonas_sp.AAC.1